MKIKPAVEKSARYRAILAFTAFILLCVLVAGCARPKIYSKWRNNEINIDGRSAEWKNDLIYYNEDKGINIGVANDDAYLYICLIIRNYGITEQLKRSGFTVWFDPTGGTERTFGIRFPVGKQGPMGETDEGRRRSRLKDKKEPPGTFQEAWQPVEFIGPDKERRYITTVEDAGNYGIGVRAGESEGYFAYELKVPLARSELHPYAIGSNLNKPLGVGFETAGLNMGMMRGPHGGMGGIPGSRMRGASGGRGGGPGGMGRMPEGGMSDRENSLRLWITVIYAKEKDKT